MSKPFTIKIFLPDGDPNGVQIISRSGWTGRGILCPRKDWDRIRGRSEFKNPGIYLLVGVGEAEKPKIYIGQTDELQYRLDDHSKKRTFWDWFIAFTATDDSFNSALVQWLEYALVQRAKKYNLIELDNTSTPNAPALSEDALAEMSNFLDEILQILPLVGITAFNTPKALSQQQIATTIPSPISFVNTTVASSVDTIIVPANLEGFQDVFIGQNAWWEIRIASHMLPKIKYVAVYQTAPVMAITHYAPVASIESFGTSGKYKLNFAEPAKPIGPISAGDAPNGTMQSSRYTSLQKLLKARTIPDLFPFGETPAT